MIDRVVKNKLIEMSTKLKTMASTYPNRLEYLITEIDEGMVHEPLQTL